MSNNNDSSSDNDVVFAGQLNSKYRAPTQLSGVSQPKGSIITKAATFNVATGESKYKNVKEKQSRNRTLSEHDSSNKKWNPFNKKKNKDKKKKPEKNKNENNNNKNNKNDSHGLSDENDNTQDIIIQQSSTLNEFAFPKREQSSNNNNGITLNEPVAFRAKSQPQSGGPSTYYDNSNNINLPSGGYSYNLDGNSNIKLTKKNGILYLLDIIMAIFYIGITITFISTISTNCKKDCKLTKLDKSFIDVILDFEFKSITYKQSCRDNTYYIYYENTTINTSFDNPNLTLLDNGDFNAFKSDYKSKDSVIRSNKMYLVRSESNCGASKLISKSGNTMNSFVEYKPKSENFSGTIIIWLIMFILTIIMYILSIYTYYYYLPIIYVNKAFKGDIRVYLSWNILRIGYILYMFLMFSIYSFIFIGKGDNFIIFVNESYPSYFITALGTTSLIFWGFGFILCCCCTCLAEGSDNCISPDNAVTRNVSGNNGNNDRGTYGCHILLFIPKLKRHNDDISELESILAIVYVITLIACIIYIILCIYPFIFFINGIFDNTIQYPNSIFAIIFLIYIIFIIGQIIYFLRDVLCPCIYKKKRRNNNRNSNVVSNSSSS